MPKYEYFVHFDPMSYYWHCCTVMDLLMPYWHNKNEYSNEEVTDLLKQVYNHLVCILLLVLFHSWLTHSPCTGAQCCCS